MVSIRSILWFLAVASVANCRQLPRAANKQAPANGEREAIRDKFMARQTCDVATVNIDAATQAIFVQLHNQYRANEKAAGMMRMSWSDALAQRAQAWTNYLLASNTFGHGYDSLCDGTELGQNAWSGSSSGGSAWNITSAVSSWQSERVNFIYSSNQCKVNKTCGHYTQNVWDESYLLGCGYSFSATNQYVICNYFPPGNWQGEYPFSMGTINAAACKSTTPTPPADGMGIMVDSDGLCNFCQAGSSGCVAY